MLEQLVAPLDVVKRKRDLLDRLEPHDLGDFLGFNRRKLDEACKARLPADTHADNAAFHRMALHEAGQRGGDQLFAVVASVGEDGFVLDDLKFVDPNAIAFTDQLYGFQGTVTDIDSPGKFGTGHLG